MRVISKTSDSEIASVFIAEDNKGRLLEFVESTQPPFTINQKWVLIISTLFGCPVDCKFCDAGGSYNGIVSYDQLKFQIDYLINRRFPDGYIDSDKFKIQFARMGEPAFNPNVLSILEDFPTLYNYRYFLPSLSTIAPASTGCFFDKLLEIKHKLYADTFQLQFSIHSTDIEQRDQLIPVKKWSFEQIGKYSKEFYQLGGKKITLNFAVSQQNIIEPEKILDYFDPAIFLIKLTPLNPTYKASANGMFNVISGDGQNLEIIERFTSCGYDVIISIGELEENKIGSNCGQYISKHQGCEAKTDDSYLYPLISV